MSCEIYDFNLYYDNSYRFEIIRYNNDDTSTELYRKYKKVVMNVLQYKHPSLEVKNNLSVPFHTGDIFTHGVKLMYGKPLRVRILLDSELDIYSYFYQWFKTINPMKNITDLEIDDPQKEIYCDLKLSLLKNNGDFRDKYFLYQNCYPKSISDLQMQTTGNEKKELFIDVDFMYNSFTLNEGE